jgi:hypothetical protein
LNLRNLCSGTDFPQKNRARYLRMSFEIKWS